MFLLPPQYAATPVSVLLGEAARGRVPVDQLLLKSLIERPDAVVEFLAGLTEEATEDWTFDLTPELLDLARYFADARLVPFLIETLNDEDPPSEVYDAIVAIGAKALEPLLAAYEKASEPHRREIAFALAALGIEDPRIEAILATRDPDEAAMELYRDRGDRTPEAWDIFAEYAERGVPEVEALSVDERIEMLASDDEEYRILAAASLFHEDLDQRDEDILFARARTDSSETVRAHCWQALDNAINREEIATEMIARLQDTSRSDQERSALLIGLSAISDRPEIRPHLEAFYRKPETRLKALEAMWRSLDPDFTEYFPEHLNDPDLDIRRVALRGVGGLGITSELGKVRKLLRDPEVREDALYAYAMASPGKSSPAFLRSLLDRIKKEAGPLSEEEEEVVRIALDERLRAEGKPPIFLRGES